MVKQRGDLLVADDKGGARILPKHVLIVSLLYLFLVLCGHVGLKLTAPLPDAPQTQPPEPEQAHEMPPPPQDGPAEPHVEM